MRTLSLPEYAYGNLIGILHDIEDINEEAKEILIFLGEEGENNEDI